MVALTRLMHMFDCRIRRMPRPQEVSRMTTDEIRDSFLLQELFSPDVFRGAFTDLDRMVVAGAMPVRRSVSLPNHKESGRESFLERRELGAINTGGPGSITVDGTVHAVSRSAASMWAWAGATWNSPARIRHARQNFSC